MVYTRENSIRIQFQRSDPRPDMYELYTFLVDTLGVSTDAIGGLQLDNPSYSFLVKFDLQYRFERILSSFESGASFKYKSGRCVQVKVSDASLVSKSVKVVGLPFELPDTIIKNFLENFGSVKQITRDTWQDQYFGSIENGTRTALMHLKKAIPSKIVIEGSTGFINYSGQERTCHYCHEVGHFVIDCPKKVKSSSPTAHNGNRQFRDVVSDIQRPPAPVISMGNDIQTTYTVLNDEHSVNSVSKTALPLDNKANVLRPPTLQSTTSKVVESQEMAIEVDEDSFGKIIKETMSQDIIEETQSLPRSIEDELLSLDDEGQRATDSETSETQFHSGKRRSRERAGHSPKEKKKNIKKLLV